MLRAFNFETFSFRDLLLVRPDGTVWAAARPRPRNLPLPLTPPDASTASHPGAVCRRRADLQSNQPATGPGTSPDQSTCAESAGCRRLPKYLSHPSWHCLRPSARCRVVRIYIERPDGLRLASLPHDELKVGKQQVAAISSLGTDGIAFNLPSWLITSPTIAVWRNTLYPDVQVALTLDLSASMADWARDRDRLLIALGVACLLVLALAGSHCTRLCVSASESRRNARSPVIFWMARSRRCQTASSCGTSKIA